MVEGGATEGGFLLQFDSSSLAVYDDVDVYLDEQRALSRGLDDESRN